MFSRTVSIQQSAPRDASENVILSNAKLSQIQRRNVMVFRGKKKKYLEFVSLISGSDFFDANWYYEKYPDVRASKMDPALHYYLYGAGEGRDPSANFSTSTYLRDHPSLIGTGENPIVHYELRKNGLDPSSLKTTDLNRAERKVPGILHQVWLSGDAVPPPLSLSLKTFLRLHPDFEVKKWNIDSLEGDETPFFRDSLREKKWAFATDYIRLKALYEHGGVYADGDVAFYRPIYRYMQFESVLCWENYFAIGPHFMMAAPQNAIIGRILDVYRSRNFYENEQLNLTPIPVIVTWLLTTEFGLRLDGSRQILDGANLVEAENIFTTNFNDDKCVAEHMYYGGWVPEHNASYKDGLIDMANNWAKENNALKLELRRKKLTTPSDEWSHYFLRNAEVAFPAMREISGLEQFKYLQKLALSGAPIAQKRVVDAVGIANPLNAISSWHLKPKSVHVPSPPVTRESVEFPSRLTKVIKQASHKVSVVVPIYNVEKYLVKCLKSIQAQDHHHIEVILVNDGSTDNSGKIAKAITEVDTRFKLLEKPNGGLGDARNFAIKHLDSDLVTFVDSDDFLDAHHISLLESSFRQGHDLAICDFKVTAPDGRLIETRELGKFWGEPDPVAQALVSNYECYAWNKMYLTDTFTGNDAARYSLGWFEDFAITPALVGSAKNIGFVGAATYNYVQRPDSILSNSRRNVERNIEVFAALEMLGRHKERVPKKYWDLYFDWMAPKHYFYWRIAALLREKSHGARVAYCDLFADQLNNQVPNWDKTAYILHFIENASSPHDAMRRKRLVEAFKSNDLAFYGLVSEPAEYGL